MDKLIVYGANCLWWDSIDKAGKNHGLPACPHCGSMLFQTTKEDWDIGVNKYDTKHPGYKGLIEWSRGKCFTTAYYQRIAYAMETGKIVA